MSEFRPANPIELSIVIPAYNEADNIMPVLQDTIATLNASQLAGRFELLLINDGSTDGSKEVADLAAQQFSCVRVFHHERNLGLGEGLKTGFRNSRGNYLTFLPADGEVKADQVLHLYADLDHADMMTSSRLGYVEGAGIRTRSLFRGILSWGFRLCIRVILGANPEKLTGIYLVRGDIVRALPLHARTALVSLEIYLHCLYNGAKMNHGATTICPRLSGVSKIANASGIWKNLWEMIQLRRQIRQHVHQQPAPAAPVKSRAA